MRGMDSSLLPTSAAGEMPSTYLFIDGKKKASIKFKDLFDLTEQVISLTGSHSFKNMLLIFFLHSGFFQV